MSTGMNKLEQHKNAINRASLDIRLEVLVADMLADELSLEDLLLCPVGIFKRRFHKDIEGAFIKEFLNNDRSCLALEVNREGLYDMLPQGLFHQTERTLDKENAKVTVNAIKRQRQIEQESRKFFLPFEQEFFYLRIRLELEERKYWNESSQIFLEDVFQAIWSFPEFLSSKQLSKLIFLLPGTQEITGDFDAIENFLTYILEDEILLRSTQNEICQHEALSPALGSVQLGISFIAGDQVADIIPGLEVRVRPASPEKVTDYLAGGRQNRVLQHLLDYVIPMEVITTIKIIPGWEEKCFQLDSRDYNGRLDYTTYL